MANTSIPTPGSTTNPIVFFDVTLGGQYQKNNMMLHSLLPIIGRSSFLRFFQPYGRPHQRLHEPNLPNVGYSDPPSMFQCMAMASMFQALIALRAQLLSVYYCPTPISSSLFKTPHLIYIH